MSKSTDGIIVYCSGCISVKEPGGFWKTPSMDLLKKIESGEIEFITVNECTLCASIKPLS